MESAAGNQTYESAQTKEGDSAKQLTKSHRNLLFGALTGVLSTLGNSLGQAQGSEQEPLVLKKG